MQTIEARNLCIDPSTNKRHTDLPFNLEEAEKCKQNSLVTRFATECLQGDRDNCWHNFNNFFDDSGNLKDLNEVEFQLKRGTRVLSSGGELTVGAKLAATYVASYAAEYKAAQSLARGLWLRAAAFSVTSWAIYGLGIYELTKDIKMVLACGQPSIEMTESRLRSCIERQVPNEEIERTFGDMMSGSRNFAKALDDLACFPQEITAINYKIACAFAEKAAEGFKKLVKGVSCSGDNQVRVADTTFTQNRSATSWTFRRVEAGTPPDQGFGIDILTPGTPGDRFIDSIIGLQPEADRRTLIALAPRIHKACPSGNNTTLPEIPRHDQR